MKGQYTIHEIQVDYNQAPPFFFFNKSFISNTVSIDIHIIYVVTEKLYALINSWVLRESKPEINYLHTLFMAIGKVMLLQSYMQVSFFEVYICS